MMEHLPDIRDDTARKDTIDDTFGAMPSNTAESLVSVADTAIPAWFVSMHRACLVFLARATHAGTSVRLLQPGGGYLLFGWARADGANQLVVTIGQDSARAQFRIRASAMMCVIVSKGFQKVLTMPHL